MISKKEQSQQSKQKILNAAFSLLADNSFDELTLNEILYEAGVSKRTFYRYFNNKQDILEAYFDSFVAGYSLLKDEILDQNSLAEVINVTLRYFLSERETMRKLIHNQKFHLLLEKFNQVAVDLHLEIGVAWHAQTANPSQTLDDILYFIVGGFFNTISHWLQEESPRPAEEVSQNIAQSIIRLGPYFGT